MNNYRFFIDFLPFDPTIKRTEGTVRNTKTGEEFKTTKGAPHILMDLLSDRDTKVKEKVESEVVRFGEMGIRTLAVAKMDLMDGRNEWKMIGLLTFLDPPRPDTKQTIVDANKYGMSNVCNDILTLSFFRYRLPVCFALGSRCKREDAYRRPLVDCEANSEDTQYGHEDIYIRESSHVGSRNEIKTSGPWKDLRQNVSCCRWLCLHVSRAQSECCVVQWFMIILITLLIYFLL
jgi:hypothetical protein